MLTEGEIDVAIYCKPEAPSEALHALPLFSERFMIGVAPGHPLAQLDEIRLKDLEGHSYLSRINCEYRDHIRSIRDEMGIEISCPYSSERDDWIQCMVLAGLGFTLIPDFAVTVPGLVTRQMIDPAFTRRVNLVTVRGQPHSPAVGAFVHTCSRYPCDGKMHASPALLGPVVAA